VKDAHTYGDGYYTWIFVRSLAFDGDVDLTNDYAICGDPWSLGADEGGHRPANPFYVGPAVFLSPVLFVVRKLVPLAADASAQWRNGCSGPLLAVTGASCAFALGATMWIAYRVARRWYSEKACALGVIVLAVASPFNVFASLTWYYSHLWAALGVAIAVLCILRADEKPESRRRWIEAGAAVGLAGLMRPQESLWGVLALASVFVHARPQRPWREAVERLAALAFGFLVVFGVQLVVYQKLYGALFVVPQGKLYVQLGHAHPWLALFGARSGFLYWTPLLWLSVLGVVPFLVDRRRRAIAASAVVVMILQFYLASSAISWTGSATMGARVQTSLAVGLLVTTAASLEAILRWTRRRRFAALAIATLALAPVAFDTWSIPVSGVANDRPVTAPELYGNAYRFAWSEVYDAVGNPWIAPAYVVWKLRYGAPAKAFDALATEGIFKRHYKKLGHAENDTLVLDRPPAAYWAENLDLAPGGGMAVRSGSRFLVALYWPWVSHVRIHARPLGNAPATLSVRTGSFFARHDVGTLTFDKEATLDLAVPPGAFDSGINEVLLATDAPLAVVSIQFVDDLPHDTSVRVFGKP
jgi:hypothetical protein